MSQQPPPSVGDELRAWFDCHFRDSECPFVTQGVTTPRQVRPIMTDEAMFIAGAVLIALALHRWIRHLDRREQHRRRDDDDPPHA